VQAYREPPEAAGPATEGPGGTLLYGVPSSVRVGPMPLPTPEERAAELEARAERISNCYCAPVPSAVLTQLAQLAAQAGMRGWEGGCPRCRQVPHNLVDSLAGALNEAASREPAQ
jgi:hypothetical protein